MVRPLWCGRYGAATMVWCVQFGVGILWCWFFMARDNVVQWCEEFFFALWNFWLHL